MTGPRILVIRLGSMGDVIAALPAVASLKHSIPHSKITWVIDPKWSLLLEGNPYVDSVVHLDRRTFTGLRQAWRDLRAARFDFAVDFQGLVKSALVATLARSESIFGFNAAYARESAASWFYSTKVPIRGYHAVERNLDLAAAAGASNILRTFPLPPGAPEAELPEEDFVLSSPLAGWGAKQWPLDYYSRLAERLRSSRIGQRSIAPGGGTRKARRGCLRADGSRAAWPVWRNYRSAAESRRGDHVSPRA
jgi:heptosyltransferase I